MTLNNKKPAALDFVFICLHQTTEALQKENYSEALAYVGDALAEVQNELDWCYRTDAILLAIRDFLLTLIEAISTAAQVTPEYRKKQVAEIITTIQGIPEEQNSILSDLVTEDTREGLPDYLEREHLTRMYTGKNE